MSIILQQLTTAWQAVIGRALDRKRDKFGRQADDAMRFLSEPDHAFMYSQAYMQNSIGLGVGEGGMGHPGRSLAFKATVNLTSNAVQVFLPVLYNRNPTRTVKPKAQAFDTSMIAKALVAVGVDPSVVVPASSEHQSIRAALFDYYLNATTREIDLKSHARLSILEALVKGMGIAWAEAFVAADGTRIVSTAHDTIDNFAVDPDGETVNGAAFIVRKRTEPVFKVEQKFRLAPGTLRHYADGYSAMGLFNTRPTDESDLTGDHTGETCNTITYYEVYSRIGMGSNLRTSQIDPEFDQALADALASFGDNVYLAIPANSGKYPFPLNIPPELFESGDDQAVLAEIQSRVSWPIPTYHDRSNPWPCAVLGFHPIPRTPYCQSHMTPAMGLQKAIDWIMSFLIGRVQITSRALMAVPQDLSDEIKDKILYGRDLELLEIESQHQGTIDKLCQFLKMPEVNGEIWKLLMALKQEWEDSTGVTELNMAARTSTQMRSAAEAGLKRDILSVRPDDMSNTVEDWLAALARLEAGAAACSLGADDIAVAFNEPKPSDIEAANASMGGVLPHTMGPATTLWMKLIAEMPVERIFGELEFSIESGSARRPNQDEQRANVDESAQLLVPAYLQLFWQTGDPSQINAWITAYAKSRNIVNYQNGLFPDMRQQMMMNQMMAAQQQSQQQQPQGSKRESNGRPAANNAQQSMLPQDQLMNMMALAGGQAPVGPDGLPPPMPLVTGA